MRRRGEGGGYPQNAGILVVIVINYSVAELLLLFETLHALKNYVAYDKNKNDN